MGKEFLGVRIDSELKAKLDRQAKENEETVTELTERALASYLQVDITKPDIFDIDKRLRALESKFRTPQKTTPKKEQPVINPDELGELITKQEAAALTGYSVNTLNRTFSQNDIFEVSKKGKAGLYRKDEILERIGIK